MKLLQFISIFIICFTSCKNESNKDEVIPEEKLVVKEVPKKKVYGFFEDDFTVVRDTVKSGDSFGAIMDAHGVGTSQVHKITTAIKDSFNVARITSGKPYTILASKDSLAQAQVFIYQNNPIDYTIVDLRDSITVQKKKKPVTIVEKSASGVINSSLLQTFSDENLSFNVAYALSDIYAWTIDFTRLQAGDRFKVIYTEKFIEDSIPAGIDEIKASYFEHKEKPIYAFKFEDDTLNHSFNYYDQEAKNLRKAFLKSPVKFSRISSKFNLKRRIKFYGNKIRPHRGTDFAAPQGTPILATADGTVTRSERRGGNGKYVKIRHNSTYETQYLHMSRQAVKKGDYVRQGDVIGYIGMTGNTSGPHVCYRFWKNGKEVDPFKQELPSSKALPEFLRPKFDKYTLPLIKKLDSIPFKPEPEIL
ncbi:peptidoglycan DD-metalloendopeptidase family protein [Aquimarina sp. ERC-38]|uniref:peptidoglycan DD-metalloendopeptidase family protein n=1 Tax=Aquimarina sp. ERC-38 TaxID=2949996 RepID=UPI002247F4A2|nr:peptidoglycan DD-metalloendopeptidase family protein [Aquimarina sp. ERC-38]UZO82125.1 peptidoglycan DD-metalloendopeptidase family protein [Aquimarina sp. ERC-38]